MESRLEKLSKILSYVLRHKPEAIDLTIDKHGWASINELLAKSAKSGTLLSRRDLLNIVNAAGKKRFILDECTDRIRAAQGHSIEIELVLSPIEPPPTLFHGTVTRSIDKIMAVGLMRRERQFVHLSDDIAAASVVGLRHGKDLVVLKIAALSLYDRGELFFLAENGVWLTKFVPPAFITIAKVDARP